MKFGKFLLRTIVGGLVGVIVWSALGGPNAMQTLALAIICTCGLSLIVIIPIAYLIGLLCTFWFIPIEGEPEGGGTLNSGTPEVGTITYIQRASLERYIQNQLKTGKNIETIREDCGLIGGWSEDSIQDAFDALKPKNQA